MNVREWLYQTLTNTVPLAAQVADRIYGAGSMETATRDKPYIVIRLEPSLPTLKEGIVDQQDVSVWVHDEPGSYVRITELLGIIRTALTSTDRKVNGFIACQWQGDSADLADDLLGTIVRNGSYRLMSKP
jgi:hypothetical protein